MAITRSLSYSEIDTALTCWARWDFAYGGRLAGDTLRPREVAPILGDGRAWGAGVATLHATGDLNQAHIAVLDSFNEDAAGMVERGLTPDPNQLVDQMILVGEILEHYAKIAERLEGLTRMEEAIEVPLPSRTGVRASSRYRYLAKIDGHTMLAEIPAIAEYKLRKQLTPAEFIEKAPQYRWYAWAYAQQIKWDGPVTVVVDETLKQAPQAARLVQAKRKDEGVDGITVSHAINQATTVKLYEDACELYGVQPKLETLEAFRSRRWHQRLPLTFSPAQLAEAGKELISAAYAIRDLDAGLLYPVRHGSAINCRGCKFRGVCSEPENTMVVDMMFERRPPKRELEGGMTRILRDRQAKALEDLEDEYETVRVVGWDRRCEGPLVELGEQIPPLYVAITGRGRQIPAKAPRREADDAQASGART